MCGVAAIIGRLDPGLLRTAQAMCDVLRHRGPDADGVWVAPDQTSALTHRRLAIIDLSEDGRQPMTDPDSGHTIVFNGEIYNYRVLRRELEALGDRFRTQSDTEVILKAYARWGRACVQRLRGMFAFVLRDAATGRVLLARDRVGIKPLYWARGPAPGGGSIVLVASELRAILQTGFVERRIDHTGLSSYLWNGFVIGPGTFIKGIQLLPAGSTAVVDPADPQVAPEIYWRPDPPVRRSTDPGPLRERLNEAVSQHLLADVPVGVFLSGGVDSSAVAAMAARAAGGTIRTFNVSFDESQYDEAPYARRVAEQLGTDHIELRLTERAFREQLGDALDSLDQPTFDAINTYFVSRLVRDTGLKVALAGTGGDEIFGGYRSFAELPYLRRLARASAAMPRSMVRAAAYAVARLKTGRPGVVPPQTRWGKLPDALDTGGSLVDLYQVAYGLFTTDFLRKLTANGDLSPTRRGLPLVRAAELEALIQSSRELSAISTLEVALYLGERLLRDTDCASMAVSLEVRVPLLDHEVIEAANALDDDVRFEPVRYKGLLRRIGLIGLDPAIFDRPKSGFVLPLEVWCRRDLADLVQSTLLDRSLCESVGLSPDAVERLWAAFQAGAPGLYWSRIWAVFVVLWWSRRYGVTRA